MSRLLQSSDQEIQEIQSRNLYTPNDPYNIDTSRFIDTVNNIASVVKPFSSFDLSNTVFGRVIGPNTPITQIGLEMLGRQFGATVASQSTAEFLPSIRFENIFDGDPSTKLFTKKIDFEITRRENQTTIGRFLERATGVQPLTNPFGRNTTSEDLIRNTGKGQLSILNDNLYRNRYKKSDTSFVNALESQEITLGSSEVVIQNKTYFSFNDLNYYPFATTYNSALVELSNEQLVIEESRFVSNTSNPNKSLEYGSTQEFIDRLGKTNKRINTDDGQNIRLDPQDYGLPEDNRDQLIWGRDGASQEYTRIKNGFDDIFDGETPQNPRFSDVDQFSSFGAEKGLLNYTKELLNIRGKFANFDQTKKKFVDKNNNLSFNGSPLTQRLDENGNLGPTDRRRQHNVADPYDRYVKAIRYNGNNIYGGNQNSVIFDSVVPKFTPRLNDGGIIDNRRVMFSIENLAARVAGDPERNVAYLDDEFGTELPLCEAGPFGGRIMWFPPYDIQLNEQSIARHEATNFIGRGEPIYTYNNSERIANLSFKLLIDYPPEAKGKNHTQASSFFAFGGPTNRIQRISEQIGQKEAERERIQRQLKDIQPEVEVAQQQISYPPELDFHFPNDYPTQGQIEGGIQDLLNRGYEDGVINDQEIDGKDFGLNVNFAQNLQNNIATFLNEENRPFTKIVLIGSSSTLFRGDNGFEYNLRLSERRIQSVLRYINEIYKQQFNRTLEQDGIEIVTNPLGGVGGESTDEESEIPSRAAKEARRVGILFQRNSVQPTVERNEITPEERVAINNLTNELTAIDQSLNNLRVQFSECLFNAETEEDGIMKGFRSLEEDKFSPVFHSQTPEDFHRRITFLHQCTRQGNAVRKVRESDNGEISFSAKNAVFGRQPISVLRIGDFFYTKVVIENISFDYTDAPWDLNPEGIGAQYMIANITMQVKVIGGQSLRGPINALQNAVSFNYQANSTFLNTGVYRTARRAETAQFGEDNGITSATENDELLSGLRNRNESNQNVALNNNSLPDS